MVTGERQKESEVKVSKLVLMCPQLHMATRERQKESMIMFCQHHITTSDSRTKNEESKMREKPYLIFPGLLLVWQFFRGIGQQCHTWQQHGHTSSSKIHSCLAPFLLHANNMDTHPHLNPLRLCIIPAPCQHGQTPSSQSTRALYHFFFTPATRTHTIISIHSLHTTPFFLYTSNMYTHPHLNPLVTWTGSHCTLHHSFFIPPLTTKPRTHTRRKKLMGVGYMGTR